VTCTNCRHHHDSECRESPPQVYAVLVPSQKASIMQAGQMTMELHLSSAYPRPDPTRPCSKHRAIDN
jgi:hypothetical protein